MKHILPVLLVLALFGCATGDKAASEAEAKNTYALAGVSVTRSIHRRQEPGGPDVDCVIPSNAKMTSKMKDTRPIAGKMGKWFLHGLSTRAGLPLKTGKDVTANELYRKLLPVEHNGHIAVGSYHAYGRKDYPRLHSLAAPLGVGKILVLTLIPEYTILDSTNRNTSIRPGILVQAMIVDSISKRQTLKEYRYESERIINDTSLAGACIKIRRSFEYYDSHLAGMQAATYLWQ